MVAWALLRFWLAVVQVNAAFDIFSVGAGEEVGLFLACPSYIDSMYTPTPSM